ncbi:MAG: hypothetical protein QOE64_1185 [Frankiales bacterium]|nr:hypothetical protein [Frankiales bacterium]
MIDFRYHIVSIAAVFLALALGLVLGSTSGFQNNAIGDLDKHISQLRKQSNDLRSVVDREQGLLKKGDELVTVLTPSLIKDALEGEHVAVVSAPGANGSLRDAAEEAVTAAGGTIASEVSLSADFFTQDNVAVLAGLVDRLAPSVPTEGSALDRAAKALSDALLVSDKSRTGNQLGSSDTALVAGFREAKLVSVSDNPVRASLVVFVAAPPQDKADPDLEGEVRVAAALDEAGRGSVVVGAEQAGAPAHGLVRAVRATGEVAAVVSTVDDAATPAGRLRLVRALSAERTGLAGQYGTGDGAQAVIATPTPSP